MSRQLSDAYVEHETTMKKMLEESVSIQKEYISVAGRIVQDNQTIQKQQQADYQHLADYLKEAETSSAKFWVACNQSSAEICRGCSAWNGTYFCSGQR